MSVLYSLLFFLTPFLFSTANSEQFELPKMYFIYGLTVAILGLHLFNYLRGKAPLFRKTFLDIPLLLFLSSQIISTIFSVDIHTSFFGYYSRMNGGLLSLITFCLLYWILVVYINESYKQKIIFYSLASGLIISIYGILEHFGIDKDYWRQDVMARVFSTFGQPNWLAAYLCILLPFSLDKLLSSKTHSLRITYYGLLVTFYTCLLYTKSKSGILAAIISLGIYGLIYFIKNKSSRLFLVSCFITLASFSFLLPNPIKDYFFHPKITDSSLKIEDSTLNITPSEDIRKIVWQGATSIWKQYPFFGTGPETFAYTYYWVRPASHNLTSEWNFLYNKAHNEYLNYLATTGTFGFISYLILIISVLYVIRNTLYLIPFISILISNSVGFSVAMISLYFFILPALILDPIKFKPTLQKSFYVLRITCYLLLFLFLESKLLLYYLADITYYQATIYDTQQKYAQAFEQIKLSYRYRSNEPNYLIKYSDLSAKLAVVTKENSYVAPAILTANLATKISPFDVNLWKQKAQIYYYLSALDSQYFPQALNSMATATRLAPTDAISYYLLGTFYESIKEIDKALLNYQKALELKPNYDHASFSIGKIYFNQKKYDQAKPMFDKTLSIAPTNLEAQSFLAKIATISATKK